MRSSEAQQKQKWQKLNMSKGQESEDLSAKHHLPQNKEKSENDAKCNRRRINIGEEFGRWTDLKTVSD